MSVNTEQAKNRKVVHLEFRNFKVKRACLSKLPTVVSMLRDKSKQLLLQRLKLFFDKVDDSFFELADKADSHQEQNLFFDAMREVRVRRRRIEKNMVLAVEDAFANLMLDEAQEKLSDDDTEQAEIALTQIYIPQPSLEQNEPLEEFAAAEAIVAKAHSEFAEDIQLLSLRIDSLVPQKVYQKNNPIGPDVLCAAFISEAKKLNLEFQARQVLFNLFDRFVLSQLRHLYHAANQLLVENNVLPNLCLTAILPPKQMARPSPTAAAAHSAESDTNEQVQGEQTSEDAINHRLAMAQPGDMLQEEMLPNEVSQDVLSREPSPSLPSSELRELLNYLSQQQKQSLTKSGGLNLHSPHLAEVKRFLRLVCENRGDIKRSDAEAIKLVNMMFDFILRDEFLTPPMKALLSHMQIPVLKAALVDKTFFARGGHVARRLLNEMATAALGWHPSADGEGQQDPLYNKIHHLVSCINREFDDDVSLFDELLQDFAAFLDAEKRRAALMERRTLNAEDGKVKAEVARQVVATEIELRTQGQGLPVVVSKMIDEAWEKVLLVVALKYGFESDEWQCALHTLDDLLWSAKLPKDAEQRRKLILLVPDLVNRLREGMDEACCSPFVMAELFKALEEMHLSSIRRLTSSEAEQGALASQALIEEALAEETSPTEALFEEIVSEERPFVAPSADEYKEPSADLYKKPSADSSVEPLVVPPEEPNEVLPTPAVEAEQPAVEDHIPLESDEDEAGQPDDIYLHEVANFTQGAWFEMRDQDGTSSRCRLAAVIKPSGMYIFVNRNGMKVAEKTQQQLANELKLKRLRALDNSMLFDRALETVVTSLRKAR